MNSKQLNIVLGVVILILLSVIGYLYFRNNLKREESTSTQTNTLTQSNQKVENVPTNNQSSSTPLKDDEVTMTSSGYMYKNNTYGFTMTFPDTWEGLTTRFVSQEEDNLGKYKIIYFQVPLHTCKEYPNPQTGTCYAAPFAISVYPKIYAAKVGNSKEESPGFLGSTDTEIFVYQPWQDPPEDLQKFDFQISKVASSFKFVK